MEKSHIIKSSNYDALDRFFEIVEGAFMRIK